MGQIRPQISSLLFLLLLTTSTPAISAAFSFSRSYSQYKTAFSLSHSLITRVSNLRSARGDISGANRAKLIAQKLERGLGLGFWGLAWSAGWDYAKSYAWRDLDSRELYGVVSDLNKLLGFLGELTRAESEVARAAWVARNYGDVLRVAKSALRRFVKVFGQSVRCYFKLCFFFGSYFMLFSRRSSSLFYVCMGFGIGREH